MSIRHLTAILLSASVVGCGSTESADHRVTSVMVIGTEVPDTVYADRLFELLIVPLNRHGTAVLEQGISFDARMISPAGISVRVLDSECVRNREREPLAVGIVVDTSGSMRLADPDSATGAAPLRKAAVKQIIGTMQAGDLALLTDFNGNSSTDPLRDLVCLANTTESPPPPCTATADSLTSDMAALIVGTEAIVNNEGTPLYEACLQMTRILGPQTGHRKAIIFLSDGLPSEPQARTTCLDSSRSANVSIFTLGYGTDAVGIQAMRELAESTGGAYATATDQTQLATIMSDMGYSDGYCKVTLELTGIDKLAAGVPVDGEVTAGDAGATVNFEFLAPPRP